MGERGVNNHPQENKIFFTERGRGKEREREGKEKEERGESEERRNGEKERGKKG